MSVNIAGSANLTGRVTVGANQIDPIQDGLILYLDAGNPYSWTDSSITTREWYDLSGRGKNTYFENNPFGMDTWGYADNGKKSIGTLTFEGDRPAIITGVEFPNTSYTKCAWVNFNARDYLSGPYAGGAEFTQSIIGGIPGYLNSPHRLWYDGKDIWADNNGGGGVKTERPKNNPIIPGTWHFICVTWSVDAGWNLYIDGILEAYAYDSTPLYGNDNNQTVFIGSEDSGSNPMYGMMSIAMMYNRVLSAQEVAYMYSKFAVRYKKNNPLFVGQSYGGGVIINITNGTNGHAEGIIDLGLLQSTYYWCQPEAPLISLGTTYGITSGSSNTDIIISYTSDYPNYGFTAAWAARNNGPYPDCYLPPVEYHTFILDSKDFFDKRLYDLGDPYNPAIQVWTSSEISGEGEEPNPDSAYRVLYESTSVEFQFRNKTNGYRARIARNFNI